MSREREGSGMAGQCTGLAVLPFRTRSRCKSNFLLHVLSLRLLCVIQVEMSSCDLRLSGGIHSFVECLLYASCYTYSSSNE